MSASVRQLQSLLGTHHYDADTIAMIHQKMNGIPYNQLQLLQTLVNKDDAISLVTLLAPLLQTGNALPDASSQPHALVLYAFIHLRAGCYQGAYCMFYNVLSSSGVQLDEYLWWQSLFAYALSFHGMSRFDQQTSFLEFMHVATRIAEERYAQYLSVPQTEGILLFLLLARIMASCMAIQLVDIYDAKLITDNDTKASLCRHTRIITTDWIKIPRLIALFEQQCSTEHMLFTPHVLEHEVQCVVYDQLAKKTVECISTQFPSLSSQWTPLIDRTILVIPYVTAASSGPTTPTLDTIKQIELYHHHEVMALQNLVVQLTQERDEMKRMLKEYE